MHYPNLLRLVFKEDPDVPKLKRENLMSISYEI
jgi:hypothetical protein